MASAQAHPVYAMRPVSMDRMAPAAHGRKRPGAYDCFGVEGRTWLTIGRFLLIVYIMMLVQQWVDSRPRTNNDQCEIGDTLFFIIPDLPRITGDMVSASVADFWMVIHIVTFFLWIAVTSPNRQLWVRRWFTLWGNGYGLRALVVGLTWYYAPAFKDHEGYVSSNPFYGALVMLAQVRSSLTDLMFSGHTLTFVLSARFVYYYGVSIMFRSFYVISAIFGPILLIAVREHYSADVGVAAIVAYLVFEVYHLWYVRGYRQRWLRVWEIEVSEPIVVIYPVQVTLGDGTQLVIGQERAGERELIGGHVSPERDALMKVLRYIDGDEVPRRAPINQHQI